MLKLWRLLEPPFGMVVPLLDVDVRRFEPFIAEEEEAVALDDQHRRHNGSIARGSPTRLRSAGWSARRRSHKIQDDTAQRMWRYSCAHPFSALERHCAKLRPRHFRSNSSRWQRSAL